MFAFEGLLGPTFRMVAVLTHSVGVVWHFVVTTFCDLMSMLLLFNGFSFWQNNILNRVTLNFALVRNHDLFQLPLLNKTLFDNYRKVILFALVGIVFG